MVVAATVPLLANPQFWAVVVPVLSTAISGGGRWISQQVRERNRRNMLNRFDTLSSQNQQSLRQLREIATLLTICDTLYEDAAGPNRTRWTGVYGLVFGIFILFDMPAGNGAFLAPPGFDIDAIDPALAVLLAFIAPFLGRLTSKFAETEWFQRFRGKLDRMEDDARLRYARSRRLVEQQFITRLYQDVLTPAAHALGQPPIDPNEKRKRLWG